MSNTAPSQLIDFIVQLSQKEGFKLKDLRNSYAKLSSAYQTKQKASSIRFSKEEAFAYSLGRMPATMAVFSSILKRLKQAVPSFSPHCLLDLGSGPGSALWASFDTLPTLQTFTAIEANPYFIELSQEIAAIFYPALTPIWKQGDILSFLSPSTTEDTYDVTILSYVLGELPHSSYTSLLGKVWDKTKDVLIIINPGTPEGFHSLLKARSFFIQSEFSHPCHILAPCPHAYACPLENKQDWCHFSAYVSRSKAHTIVKEGSLPYEQEKFSYLIIKRGMSETPSPARIIKKPLVRKGHIHLDLCTSEGKEARTTISKRQKEAYLKAKYLSWGDSWHL